MSKPLTTDHLKRIRAMASRPDHEKDARFLGVFDLLDEVERQRRLLKATAMDLQSHPEDADRIRKNTLNSCGDGEPMTDERLAQIRSELQCWQKLGWTDSRELLAEVDRLRVELKQSARIRYIGRLPARTVGDCD